MSGPETAAATAVARSNAFFIVETPLRSRIIGSTVDGRRSASQVLRSIGASLDQSFRPRHSQAREGGFPCYGLPTTRQSRPAAFMAVQRSWAAATVANGP